MSDIHEGIIVPNDKAREDFIRQQQLDFWAFMKELGAVEIDINDIAKGGRYQKGGK